MKKHKSALVPLPPQKFARIRLPGALRNRVTIRCDHCKKTMAKAVVDRGDHEMSAAMKVFEEGIKSHSPKCPYRCVAVTFSIMPVGPGAHSKIGGRS